MNILLVYPRFPQSFWSFDKTLELVGLKAQLPPLGLVTVAAILPQTWDYKLVDRNVREVRDDEWRWADIVIISAMIVHRVDFLDAVQTAKRYGKLVAVGGPYPTAIPQESEAAGADFLVLDEGEITLPMFVEAVERGDRSGTFRSGGEKPDVTSTPVPRYDLLEMDAYAEMSVQFSRGCPFQCEFCDIIVLYGRKPRTKDPEQLLAELQCLYDLGWRRSIFMVDDNFIGNKRNVKLLLKAMKPWMEEHGYPFSFATEASVDLAQDPELMQMMVDCNFGTVFLGIETPDDESLNMTKKFQNMRDPLSESVISIAQAGLRVMAGLIVGFDGEKSGAGRRIYEFVEQTAIPTALVSMLQALPDTALSHRLEKEGRLLSKSADINQTTLMNFVPTRPIEEITEEYIQVFWDLYDPLTVLNRTFRHFLMLGEAQKRNYKNRTTSAGAPDVNWVTIRAFLIVVWRQGVLRKTRLRFWINLAIMLWRYPAVAANYISVCAQAEHFIDFRQLVRQNIEEQLAAYLEAKKLTDQTAATTASVESVAMPVS
ncbi:MULTISPECIES: B12-binding domain-containing radical SAM protein [Cyanophyceae]|uniref:B12-binding domain-containing radical SAM protein n=1 Tax=Leptolyngbya subtilissima DQ-A4 TaxID=2933933 RepID=A0ABV0K224_9CYAN|nr:B12-binding domain-containing radical SAM protein [Nodosilinea sp. FACHB-141]MBD2111526.1 B12-binding domain-containing radical SAM protein [Nodosilinea sp. FACHB-141]